MGMEKTEQKNKQRNAFALLYKSLFFLLLTASSAGLTAEFSSNDTPLRSSECQLAIDTVLENYLGRKDYAGVKKLLQGFIESKEKEIAAAPKDKTSKLEKDLLSDLFIIETALNMAFKSNFSARLVRAVNLNLSKRSRKESREYLVASLSELLKQGPRQILKKAIETNSEYVAGKGFGDGRAKYAMSEAELGALSLVVEMSQHFVQRRQKRKSLLKRIFKMAAPEYYEWLKGDNFDVDTGLGELRKQVGQMTALYQHYRESNPANRNTDFRHFRDWFIQKIEKEITTRTAIRKHLYWGVVDVELFSGDIKELKIVLAELKGQPHTLTQRFQRELSTLMHGDIPLGARVFQYAWKNPAILAGLYGLGAVGLWAQYGGLVLGHMPPAPDQVFTEFEVTGDDLRSTADLTGDGQFDVRDALRHIEKREKETPEELKKRLEEMQKKRDQQNQQ